MPHRGPSPPPLSVLSRLSCRSTCPWTSVPARPAPSAAASPRPRWAVSCGAAVGASSSACAVHVRSSSLFSLPASVGAPAGQRQDREGSQEGERLPAAQVRCQGVSLLWRRLTRQQHARVTPDHSRSQRHSRLVSLKYTAGGSGGQVLEYRVMECVHAWRGGLEARGAAAGAGEQRTLWRTQRRRYAAAHAGLAVRSPNAARGRHTVEQSWRSGGHLLWRLGDHRIHSVHRFLQLLPDCLQARQWEL